MAKFEPGVSGNPGGRPKGLRELVRETVEREGPGGRDGWVELIRAQYKIANGTDERAGAKDSTAAATFLASYGYGRPQQAVDVTSNGQTVAAATVTIPLATEALTDEQLVALQRALDKAALPEASGGGDAGADDAG